MSEFCTSCGKPLGKDAKFCSGCGVAAARVASSEKEASAPKGATKAAGIPRTVTEQKTAGPASYIAGYIRLSLAVLKNPRQLLPTFVLGLVWLVLALLGSLGINPLPVRI